MKKAENIPELSSGHLQHSTFFAEIPLEIRSSALINSREVSFAKKQVVFNEGDSATGIFLVLSGVFKLYKTADSVHRTLHDIVVKDDLVAGLLMQDTHSCYPVTLECIEPGSVLCIPRSTYEAYWQISAPLLVQMQKMNYQRMHSIQQLRETQKYPTEKRLAMVCLHFLNKLSSDHSHLQLPMTRADLADLIGASSETVIRTMTKWKSKKIVTEQNGEEWIDLNLLNQHLEEC